jgi:hypothetical protein
MRLPLLMRNPYVLRVLLHDVLQSRHTRNRGCIRLCDHVHAQLLCPAPSPSCASSAAVDNNHPPLSMSSLVIHLPLPSLLLASRSTAHRSHSFLSLCFAATGDVGALRFALRQLANRISGGSARRKELSRHSYKDVLAIEACTLQPGEIKVSMGEVVGLDRVKRLAYELTVLPFKNPDLFTVGITVSSSYSCPYAVYLQWCI